MQSETKWLKYLPTFPQKMWNMNVFVDKMKQWNINTCTRLKNEEPVIKYEHIYSNNIQKLSEVYKRFEDLRGE